MMWPFHKEPTGPSAAARRAMEISERQLEVARRQREEARTVGSSLRDSREANHYAMALAEVFKTGGSQS